MKDETMGGQVIHKFRSKVNGVNRIILDTREITVKKVYNAKTNVSYSFTVYPYNYITNDVNHQLVITLDKPLIYNEEISVAIEYTASHNATAVNWVPREQTFGKKYKFMYTQCEAIQCRSIVPLQDTPSVKSTFNANLKIEKDYVALASAVFDKKEDAGNNKVVYKYSQNIPVPSYLLALVSGDIKYKSTGRRTGVYAEPVMLDKSADELREMELFMDTIESVVTPYVWGNYSVIIMPPSFPFGGMENPYLTFVSPSIILGDRSSAYVVAHEICHSWFGNQLTGRNWTHFWLNEGFTVYSERLIARRIHGDERFTSQARIGVDNVKDVIEQFKAQGRLECTKLFPNIYHDGPDDIMSNVAYEKGFLFLRHLESLIGVDHFYGFLRYYVSTYSFKSVEVWDMKAAFETYVRVHFKEKTENILNKIDWNKWLMEPGMPEIGKNQYTNKYITEAITLANYYIEHDDSPKENNYKKFELDLRVIFMRTLAIADKKMTKAKVERIDKDNNVTKTELNPEVSSLWFRIAIEQKYEGVNAKVDTFLGSIGRQKYIIPLYKAYAGYEAGKKKAKELYDKYKSRYHPIAQKAIEKAIS